jgi:hypothetical protein
MARTKGDLRSPACAGPGACICDECAGLCNEIIEKGRARGVPGQIVLIAIAVTLAIPYYPGDVWAEAGDLRPDDAEAGRLIQPALT